MAKNGSKANASTGRGPKALKSTGRLKPEQTLAPTSSVPLELQQKCLDIFQTTTQPTSEDTATLQEVKGHLYNRDFAAAFGKDEYLRVYSSRWSPSRALAYLQIFTNIQDLLFTNASSGSEYGKLDKPFRALCIGGGAGAELLALAAWRSTWNEPAITPDRRIEARLVDIASWGGLVQLLNKSITVAPELSKYASQAKRDANQSLVDPEAFSAEFEQLDILSTTGGTDDPTAHFFEEADMVTFMFTLNELYSTSMPKTQHLLSRLSKSAQPGCHLLVVDSPGSYSTVSINGADKKYPMHWLLDYAMLGPSDEANTIDKPGNWKKLISTDSQWFRIPEGLQYPIALENMRYQLHLYQKSRG